jgi:hypothetical protein
MALRNQECYESSFVATFPSTKIAVASFTASCSIKQNSYTGVWEILVPKLTIAAGAGGTETVTSSTALPVPAPGGIIRKEVQCDANGTTKAGYATLQVNKKLTITFDTPAAAGNNTINAFAISYAAN